MLIKEEGERDILGLKIMSDNYIKLANWTTLFQFNI